MPEGGPRLGSAAMRPHDVVVGDPGYGRAANPWWMHPPRSVQVSRRYAGGVQPYFTPRCLGLHAIMLVLLPAFTWLTLWQLDRALGGNVLSWAYVVLWPLFGLYAIYLWWQLIHDEPSRPGAEPPTSDGRGATGIPAPTASSTTEGDRAPGWALTGGRKRNVAIAAAHPIDAESGGRGERFRAQTPEEAAQLEQYNRYLAALAAEDSAEETR